MDYCASERQTDRITNKSFTELTGQEHLINIGLWIVIIAIGYGVYALCGIFRKSRRR